MLNDLLTTTRTVRILINFKGCLALLFPCPSSYATAGELLHPCSQQETAGNLPLHGRSMGRGCLQAPGREWGSSAVPEPLQLRSLWGEDQVPDHTVLVTRLQCFKNRSWSLLKLHWQGLGGEKEPQLLSPNLSKLHSGIFWKVYEYPHAWWCHINFV